MTLHRKVMSASGGSGGAPLSSLSNVSYSTAYNTIPIPSEAAEGDIAIFYESGLYGLYGDIDGWTIAADGVGAYFRDRTHTKVLTAADIGTSVTTSNPPDVHSLVSLVIFRPDVPVVSIDVTTLNLQTETHDAPAPQDLPVPAVGPPNLLMAFYGGWVGSPQLRNVTEDWEVIYSGTEGNMQLAAAWDIQNEVTAAKTVSIVFDAGVYYNRLCSFVFNFTT